MSPKREAVAAATAAVCVMLGAQGCHDEVRSSPKQPGTPIATTGIDDEVERARDERARRVELNGSAGSALPEEPVQSAPLR
jgi:hypothetical protein